jgi:hypothetical protein
LKAARLKVSSACLEDIDWRASRGLEPGGHHQPGRRRLAAPWPQRAAHRRHRVRQDLAGCALGQQAARQGFSVLYTRAPRLLQELHVAHGDGSFGKRLAQLARLDLLVLDDFGIAPIAAHERNDLLELLDDRVGTAHAHHQPVAGDGLARLAGRAHASPTPSWTGCCTARTP